MTDRHQGSGGERARAPTCSASTKSTRHATTPQRESGRERKGAIWGGKGAGADTQRVDKIDTACHHPPQREGGRGGEDSNDPTHTDAQPTAPDGGGCCRSTAPARRQELWGWADAAWALSSSAADRQPQGRRSERHQGQGRQRGHRQHEAAWTAARRHGGAAHGMGYSSPVAGP